MTMRVALENLQRFYVNGAWIPPLSADTMPVVNPANEDRIATVAMGNADDVDRAVAAASVAFEGYATSTKHDRLALL